MASSTSVAIYATEESKYMEANQGSLSSGVKMVYLVGRLSLYCCFGSFVKAPCMLDLVCCYINLLLFRLRSLHQLDLVTAGQERMEKVDYLSHEGCQHNSKFCLLKLPCFLL